MTIKRLTIEIRGMHEENGHLRLADFAEQLNSIQEVLSQTDKVVSGRSGPTVYCRIVELNHSSPVTVVMEARPIHSDFDKTDATVSTFMKSLGEIKNGKAPEGFGPNGLASFKNLAKKINRGIGGLVISYNGEAQEIDQVFASHVDVIVGADRVSAGSLSGRIERINIHDNANVFWLYPLAGPSLVRCVFREDLVEGAISAVGRQVTVMGELKFKPRAEYPHEIAVREIRKHPPNDALPTLSSLRGIAPNATGGVSPEKFVRDIRDEWK